MRIGLSLFASITYEKPVLNHTNKISTGTFPVFFCHWSFQSLISNFPLATLELSRLLISNELVPHHKALLWNTVSQCGFLHLDLNHLASSQPHLEKVTPVSPTSNTSLTAPFNSHNAVRSELHRRVPPHHQSPRQALSSKSVCPASTLPLLSMLSNRYG